MAVACYGTITKALETSSSSSSSCCCCCCSFRLLLSRGLWGPWFFNPPRNCWQDWPVAFEDWSSVPTLPLGWLSSVTDGGRVKQAGVWYGVLLFSFWYFAYLYSVFVLKFVCLLWCYVALIFFGLLCLFLVLRSLRSLAMVCCFAVGLTCLAYLKLRGLQGLRVHQRSQGQWRVPTVVPSGFAIWHAVLWLWVNKNNQRPQILVFFLLPIGFFRHPFLTHRPVDFLDFITRCGCCCRLAVLDVSKSMAVLLFFNVKHQQLVKSFCGLLLVVQTKHKIIFKENNLWHILENKKNFKPKQS